MTDDRDYAEENYWRNYCDECDSSPCRSTNGHADIISAGYIRNGEMTIAHPPTWPAQSDWGNEMPVTKFVGVVIFEAIGNAVSPPGFDITPLVRATAPFKTYRLARDAVFALAKESLTAGAKNLESLGIDAGQIYAAIDRLDPYMTATYEYAINGVPGQYLARMVVAEQEM